MSLSWFQYGIFLFLSIISFSKLNENKCKEEVMWGVGSVFRREQAGQRIACASRPGIFTQPSQCERMIAQGW